MHDAFEEFKSDLFGWGKEAISSIELNFEKMISSWQ